MAADATDEALMDRYCAGDVVAFEELFRRYSKRLTRFVTPYVGPTQAEDTAQQVFLKMHHARATFRAGARVAPWLFTIGKNLALDHLRSAAHRKELRDGEDVVVPVEADDPDPSLDAAVRTAVLALPPDQRDVISLHWFGGLSFPEVAAVVGASHEAVRARAHRGYGALRERLGDVAKGLELGGAP
jgi:RNA polymerase sigma-70 factor (ECF subfamily)